MGFSVHRSSRHAELHCSRCFLVTLGLVVIYGLMNVINMAHGEFFLLGAYCVVLIQRAGLSVLVGASVGSRRCLRWSGSPSRNWSSGTFIGASSIRFSPPGVFRWL